MDTQARLDKMMKLRAQVAEALHTATSPPSAVNNCVPTMEQEQVIATYVLALMAEDVATATYQMGPV